LLLCVKFLKKMHTSVLLKEALYYLNPQQNGIYVDATFGAGGYTKAILQHTECTVVAFDRDQTTIPTAQKLQLEFGERFQFVHDKFSNIMQYISKVDGIVADFGISSMHVDDASRGFSFNKEAKLNMQMGKCDISAFEVINTFSEEKLAQIIDKYSNEHLAKKIASMIFHARKKQEIQTTTQLANIIYEAYNKPKHYKIHPATKTFQAIRIFVNCELEEIEALLNASIDLLKPNGRVVCVSFHELEDRLVKNFLAENSPKKEKINKYSIEEKNQENKPFEIITKKPVEPSTEEVMTNPRARSAKLRCGERV
jgi:16S rRNA (cytosine1402-N4)-methyltransferase